MAERDLAEETVLVYGPDGNDGVVTVEVLKDGGIEASECSSLDEMVTRLKNPLGAVVLTEDALASDSLIPFQQALEQQEFWSDVPVILLIQSDGIWAKELFARSGNIYLLERPFSRLTLIRAVEVALRARKRQFHVRAILEEQRQAAQQRDQFFATLSHELRTPINVILGWTELLIENKLATREKTHAYEILLRNARTQNALIDDLLDMSRIITNKLVLDKRLLAFNDLVRSASSGFFPLAADKKLAFSIDIEDGEYPLLADEQRISQVLSNLISNSIKFTSAGEIRISLKREGNLYITAVEDSGKGIDPAFLPFIFDRLKQEDMSTTRAHGGLGLGLAISSHIAREHGGYLTAESAGRGQGAKLSFILPAQELQSAQANTFTPAELPVMLHGARILIVDDSNDILELLKLWLHQAGAEVLSAHSAEGALSLLKSAKPDILLSDIGMPDMDGYSLINAVRALSEEEGCNIPAAALTAYAREEERTLAMNAGFQLHIPKPISKRNLISAVSLLRTMRPVNGSENA